MKNKKQTILFSTILILLAICCLTSSCLWMAFSHTEAIPDEMRAGLYPETEVMGRFQLSDWSSWASDDAWLVVFSGISLETGTAERRVYYHDKSHVYLIGPLAEELGINGLETVFVELFDERAIVGWVSSDCVTGKLKTVVFGRYEPDSSRWLEAQKSSTIEDNLFIVPISAAEYYQWDSLSFVGIETKESFSRGLDGQSSYYALERKFAPPLDISGLYR